MDQNEQIITWLRDAHAMEQSMERVLERHIKDAEDLPSLRQRLEQHLDETRTQAARLQRCLESLNSSPSRAKAMAANVIGAVEGMSTALFSDQLLKNVLADYAMEHFEIACYRSLIAAADEAGLPYVSETCTDILREETAMAEWLEEQIPEVTHLFLQRATA